MDKQVFKLIKSKELNELFRIHVIFEEKSFNLTIFQKLRAWKVTVDQEIIYTQARQLDLKFDEYYKKIQDYFRKTSENVDVSLNNNEFIVNYSLENNMKVKYFTCTLKEVDYSNCIEGLTEQFYIDSITSLQKLRSIEEERNELEKSKKSLEIKLNEFIERKKTDDEELYNNFVLIVNEKKKRIQHLNELLEAFKRGRPILNPSVEVKKRTRKNDSKSQIKTEIKNEISDSDPEDDYNTDEEKQKENQDLYHDNSKDGVSKNKNIDPIPSTSKCDDDLFDDSPPRHLLPKRIKTDTSVDINNVNKQPTVKQKSENGKNNETVYESTGDTPDINFSTQELLDNML